MKLLKSTLLLSNIRRSIVIALVYSLIAYISLQLSWKGTNASPVWPPSGIAFISVWFLGYRVWPGIWLGAFIANMAVFTHGGWTPEAAVPVSLLIGGGNTIEALFGVYLLHSFTDRDALLSRIDDVFKYIFAIMVACLASATIGTSVVYFSNPAPGVSFDMVWFTWWLGDVIGILALASLFLTFHRKLWQLLLRQNLLEAFVVSLILTLVTAAVFIVKLPENAFSSHVSYLVLPFAIWFTYRFGFPGSALSILIVSIVAVSGTIFHRGPFFGQNVQEVLVSVQCFIGVTAVTVLTLAAASYERQKTEEEIKYKEARYRSLVENSFEVIAMVDKRAKIIYTSPTTKFMLGYDDQEIVGHSMFEHIHPDDAPGVQEIFQNLLKTPGGIAQATCRMQRKNGVWRWMEGSGHNLLNDTAIGAVVINYRDVTERKLSQEQFFKAVEYSPVAKVMANKEGDIRLVNKTAEALFGYSREELLGMKIENLLPEKYRDRHIGFRKDFHDNPDTRPMGIGRELWAKRKDGSFVPIEIGLTPIETGEGFCVLASVVDITQRRKIEEILKRDKASLEKLVDERSKELIKTQRELKHFSRLADIGTLAATVAHELRNPLGVIQLAAYNLKKEKSDLGTNRHLGNIEKKVWEGNQIIDNLLSYARIKIPYYEKVRIRNILDECVSSAQGRFGEKGISIEKQFGDGPEFIEADSNQIREIMSNILNNACQSFDQNSGKVLVKSAIEGDMFKFTVQDTGTGIAKEDLERVFEPFFTRKSKGTGLGLTICNELVHLHQGRIEIESIQGHGTTVHIYLPVHRSENAETSTD